MIKAAIVGMGTWGQNLVKSVQGLSNEIQFVSGATRTPAKASDFASKYKIELTDSYTALLANPDIDAVVLATPHSMHTDQIIAAARAGKHVFSEKPLGLDSASARRAAQAAADNKVILGVGYNWRFQPALQEARRMIDDGTLGKVLHIEGNFCGPSAYRFPKGHWRHEGDESPAGGMTGRGVHVIDAMMYLAGPIDQVTAQSFRIAQDFGSDDTTSMLLHFAGGSTGYLGTIIATAETWRMQIFGSNGWVEVGDVEHLHTWDLTTCMIDKSNVTNKQKPVTKQYPAVSTERAELEHFAASIKANHPWVTPEGDAVRNAAVLEAIISSATEHRTIEID
jgi:predicted dehydrogenase